MFRVPNKFDLQHRRVRLNGRTLLCLAGPMLELKFIRSAPLYTPNSTLLEKVKIYDGTRNTVHGTQNAEQKPDYLPRRYLYV